MDNLFNYLKWRADVPFSVAPFNEIDNMLLAELVYSNLDCVPACGEQVPIRKVRDEFFNTHSREELMESSSYSAKAAVFMDEMAEAARFKDTKICFYINEIDKEKDAQLAAMTFILGDGTAYVAFRGTDSTLVGWREDFDLSYLSETEGQRRAAEYLNTVAAAVDAPLRVGGHSKGGNFAVYAASFCNREVQDRIVKVYSNDGPGFKEEVTNSQGYMRILPRILSIVPDTSIIGMLLSSKCKHKVIKSSAFGILQHDGFTWSVLRNGFEEAPTSDLGIFIEKMLGDWLEKMDDDTRRSFTYTVFTLFEATGKETFHSISEQKLKSAQAMISSMAGLPKEQRQELLHLAGNLLKSGGHTAAEYLTARNGIRAIENAT